ncbi:MAG: hypothetical protein VKK59_06385 [Vampirovibrionales bacterium]|nr:hypothetical protein [Vampirovibrionales bacterium]
MTPYVSPRSMMPHIPAGVGASGSYTYHGVTTPMTIQQITISGVTMTGLPFNAIHLLPAATQLVGWCSDGIQFRVNA